MKVEQLIGFSKERGIFIKTTIGAKGETFEKADILLESNDIRENFCSIEQFMHGIQTHNEACISEAYRMEKSHKA